MCFQKYLRHPNHHDVKRRKFTKTLHNDNRSIRTYIFRHLLMLLKLIPTVAHKYHVKTFFLTAKLSFLRQNFLSHGKTFFLTAKLSFSQQNSLSHGKTFFLTSKLFLMAKHSFVEYNILSEENTCSESEGKERYIWLMREIQSASFANTPPPLGSSRKYIRLGSSQF